MREPDALDPRIDPSDPDPKLFRDAIGGSEETGLERRDSAISSKPSSFLRERKESRFDGGSTEGGCKSTVDCGAV